MKLVQKHLFKGNREFEIIADVVYVRTKGLIKTEKLTVGLAMLTPETRVMGSELAFLGRARHEPMLSLYLNKPNAAEFNVFVEILKQRISEEAPSGSDAPGWNVYEEPPEFDDDEARRKNISFQPVNAQRVDEDITMLKTYLNEDDIRPLLVALEELKAAPENQAAYQKVVNTFNELGINQGAVLTYAPYLKILLSNTIWT